VQPAATSAVRRCRAPHFEGFFWGPPKRRPLDALFRAETEIESCERRLRLLASKVIAADPSIARMLAAFAELNRQFMRQYELLCWLNSQGFLPDTAKGWHETEDKAIGFALRSQWQDWLAALMRDADAPLPES
jgi:hypothetical protein